MLGRRLSPGQVFRINITFAEGTRFVDHIGQPFQWDGSGQTMSGMRFS